MAEPTLHRFAYDAMATTFEVVIPLEQGDEKNIEPTYARQAADAVYREIAVANGHPEWEDQIRATFARQWTASARQGWWYQDDSGSWKQK